MGDVSKINARLIDSCNSLNREGLIGLDDMKRCRNIQRSNNELDKSLEKKIFNEKRDDRLSILDNIHMFFSEKIEEEFSIIKEKIKKLKSTEKKTKITKIINKSNLGNIYNMMKIIMIETDKKIIKRYNTNEDINYDALLYNYSKIDSNRKKMEEVGQSYDTLLRVNDTEFEKLNNSSYTLHLIGVFVLLAVIIGLVIYIVKFMKI